MEGMCAVLLELECHDDNKGDDKEEDAAWVLGVRGRCRLCIS